MITPHIAHLAVALEDFGLKVFYIAEETMAAERKDFGWAVPNLRHVCLRIVENKADVREVVANAEENSIHICQGLRSNGLIYHAQHLLKNRGLRQWVIMETVNDRGWVGFLKRFEYYRLFKSRSESIDGVLAIGRGVDRWIESRGVPLYKIFQFAYFLENSPIIAHSAGLDNERKFRFIFVGRFDENKQLSMLIRALSSLQSKQFELVVVGSGPLEVQLRNEAECNLPGQVLWIGRLRNDVVFEAIGNADCLVLPSLHDGWGAVVSEALMVGTPAICSDHCGASVLVLASRRGAVFKNSCIQELTKCLEISLASGRITADERSELAQWAACLCAATGARYLYEILEHIYEGGIRPISPWSRKYENYTM